MIRFLIRYFMPDDSDENVEYVYIADSPILPYAFFLACIHAFRQCPEGKWKIRVKHLKK